MATFFRTRRSWFMNGSTKLDRGRGLRAKCKSLSKTTWNYHERRQNNSVENVFQKFALSFVSFLRKNTISDEESLLLHDEYSSKNPEFQPENSRFEVRDRNSSTSWHAQWLSCCKNASGWRPWYQERLVLKFPSGSSLWAGSLFGEKNSEEREGSSLLDQRPVHRL